jgi:hypothetical protein
VDTQQEGYLQEEWVSEEDEASMVNWSNQSFVSRT